MKKTLLAAALLAGFAGAASAQSSVTLYGVLDGGVRYQNFNLSNGPFSKVDISTSSIAVVSGTWKVKLTSTTVQLVHTANGNVLQSSVCATTPGVKLISAVN